MRGRLSIVWAVVLMLAGCRHHVQLTTLPARVDVVTEAGERFETPCRIPLPRLGTAKISLQKAGYVARDVTLSPTTRPLYLTLEQCVRIASTPAGAEVYRDGEKLGVTPLTMRVSATTEGLRLSFRRQGYLETELSVFSRRGLFPEILAVLPQDGAGRRLQRLRFDRHTGFPLFEFQRLDEEQFTGEAQDEAELVYAFGEDEYPLKVIDCARRGSLLVSVVSRAPQQAGRRYYAQLAELSLGDGGKLEPLGLKRQLEMFGDVLGETLYYLSMRTGRLDIWRCALGGKEAELVYTHRQLKSDLRACPAGGMLSFTWYASEEQGQPRVCLLVPGELGTETLRTLCAGERAAWCPDGRRLAFQLREETSGRYRLWRIEADGSQLRPLGQQAGAHEDLEVSWSPDGRWLVFSSDRAGGGDGLHDVWLVPASGGQARRLTRSSSRDSSPCFSADGQTVYFVSNRGLRWGIWSVRVAQ